MAQRALRMQEGLRPVPAHVTVSQGRAREGQPVDPRHISALAHVLSSNESRRLAAVFTATPLLGGGWPSSPAMTRPPGSGGVGRARQRAWYVRRRGDLLPGVRQLPGRPARRMRRPDVPVPR